MTVQTFLDSFTWTTGAAGTTFARSGYGFAPDAFLIWTSGRDSSVNVVGPGNHRRAVGFGVSPTDRRSAATQEMDGQATSVSDRVKRNTECLIILVSNATGAVEGSLDIQSMDGDGITFIVDDALAVAVRVHVLAFGGLTAAETGQFDNILTTGVQNVVTAGAFQPDVVFFAMTRVTATTVSADSEFIFGYGISSTKMGLLALAADDAIATTQDVRYCNDAQCCAFLNAAKTGLAGQAEFVQMNANGFRINWTTAETSARTIYYMALKGGSWTGGLFNTRTDGNDIALTGFGFVPAAALFVSHGTVESTLGTVQDHDMMSIGAATSASARAVQAVSSEDNLADSEVATAIYFDEVYIHMNLADGIDGLMDVKSFDSNGITCVMDDADPSASFGWYVAVGNASAGQTIAVAQVTETDLAQTVAWAPKRRLVGQIAESDLAQATARLKTRAISQISETDLAQAVAHLKRLLLGQTSETDLAQAISRLKTALIAVVSETDLAQPITPVRVYALVAAVEADLAQALGALKTRAIGQSTETDLAQAVARLKTVPIAATSETDTAQAMTSGKQRAIAATAETDLAQAVAPAKTKAIGQAAETDLAQAITLPGETIVPVGQALEADFAQPIARLKARVVGQSTETDLAQAVAHLKALLIGQIGEADLAQVISTLKTKLIGQSAETDLAQTISLVSALVVPVGQVFEVDLSQAVAWAPKHRFVTQTQEIDFAQIVTLAGAAPPLPPSPPGGAGSPLAFRRRVEAEAERRLRIEQEAEELLLIL
jgi:ACT domain-containing protein